MLASAVSSPTLRNVSGPAMRSGRPAGTQFAHAAPAGARGALQRTAPMQVAVGNVHIGRMHASRPQIQGAAVCVGRPIKAHPYPLQRRHASGDFGDSRLGDACLRRRGHQHGQQQRGCEANG